MAAVETRYRSVLTEPSSTIFRQVSGRNNSSGMNVATDRINRNQKILPSHQSTLQHAYYHHHHLPMPPHKLTQQPPDDWAQRRAQYTPQRSIRHILPAIGTDNAVAHKPLREGYRPTTPRRLQHPQEEKGVVVVLQREGEVGDDVDAEAEHICWSAAGGVAEACDQHGGEGLDDLVGVSISSSGRDGGMGE